MRVWRLASSGWVGETFVKRAIKIVVESGGIQYAQKRMIEIQQEAIALLHDFEDNEGRTPYALAKAYNHEKTVELLTKTCPHPYLEEDSICGVCGMDKYDFGVI